MTPARQALVRSLVASRGHVTADELAHEVAKDFPEVHLSTIYRTLDLLEEVGVIDHVHLGHGRAVYHLVGDTHRHLVCEICGTVIEVPEDTLDSFAGELQSKWGFTLKGNHFALIGMCAKCSENQENSQN